MLKEITFINLISLTLSTGFYTDINMVTSQKGKDRIKFFEMLRLKPYSDGKGSSVGYGHFIKLPAEQWMMKSITEQQANAIFNKDIEEFEKELNNVLLGAKVTQNQWDAMMSCLFNCGLTRIRTTSNLIQYVNEGKIQEAAGEFPKLDKGNFLVHLRRLAERWVFLH